MSVVITNTGLCIGACLLERGWGQGCQDLSNFGSGLQSKSRRRSQDLQKSFALVSGLARSLRRQVSLTLHDMQ
jgi:hypothetical protein